ncbi:Guanyl-specific ribonuclease Th1 [Tolypocladium ophioglossoides CBS 100239]|uniref:ribonuclease T1 n=1 Tax=Tolypocladium ophioglossoides (strain CBS 100239) TaxID=1163406 RepID=A0A0L0NFA1_TOLOC|nr:Guanyl-specific ribonuclease Th1 [Tolypocladium ophioglossoides CBS 100239]
MQLSFALLSLVAVAIVSAAPADLHIRSTTCGSHFYSDAAVNAASSAACDYVQNGGQAGSSSYPHRYNNYEGFAFNGLSGPFYEFPILSSGRVYSGGSPGADRVVITQDCQQAGQITHTGASGNNFVGCSGTN